MQTDKMKTTGYMTFANFGCLLLKAILSHKDNIIHLFMSFFYVLKETFLHNCL